MEKETAIELSEKEIAQMQETKKQERIKRVANKLQALLKEENCELDVAVIVSAKGNFPQLNIVAK